MNNPNKHVRVKSRGDDYQQERGRILTMKYGKQQMMLIRKRLRVEMWLMESLETLCKDSQVPDEYELDIDTLLDIDGGDLARRKYCQDVLKSCNVPRNRLDDFIEQLLDRLRDL